MCTYLTLRCSDSLLRQSQLEGVTADERTTLHAEAWALLSSSLPLILRRMDDNTMLPGRGTAVELAFCKRLIELTQVAGGQPPRPARLLQLESLSLGYATALRAACLVLGCIVQLRGLNMDEVLKAQAVVLCVVDSVQLAARSLAEYTLPEEIALAYIVRQVTGHFPVLFQRLSPHYVRNGRLRRWCRCAGHEACWIQQRSK